MVPKHYVIMLALLLAVNMLAVAGAVSAEEAPQGNLPLSCVILQNIRYNRNLTHIHVVWGTALNRTIELNGSAIEKLDVCTNEVNVRSSLEVEVFSGNTAVLHVVVDSLPNGYSIRRMEVDPNATIGSSFIRIREVVYEVVVVVGTDPPEAVDACTVNGLNVDCSNTSFSFIARPNELYHVVVVGRSFRVDAQIRMPSPDKKLEVYKKVEGNVSKVELTAYPRISVLSFEITAPTVSTQPVQEMKALGVRDIIEVFGSENRSFSAEVGGSAQKTLPPSPPSTALEVKTTQIDVIKVAIYAIALSILVALAPTPKARIAVMILGLALGLTLWLSGFFGVRP